MVNQTSAPQIKAWLDADVAFEFVDVRTPWEHELAAVTGATLLTQEDLERLQALPRDTRMVFLCHHGMRSHSAAMHFVQLGFTDVHNLVGGIEAWSHQVDPSVPRY
jgi:monothiol glutaredoxin